MKYLIGTRGSKLALVQTNEVIQKLKKAYPDDEFEAVIIKTTGDINQKQALDKIGSKGIFVKEIEEELLEGKIQMAVHSMKDMPDEPAKGLTFARAWKREDPRDVLVLKNAASLEELPHGAVIGTGSKRRKFQLLKLRPDLKIVGIRGNIDTRLRKLYEGEAIYDNGATTEAEGETSVTLDGIVLAAAGIKRIGRESEITQYLDYDDMIPAPAQGTLALELRADNAELMDKLDALSDDVTNICAGIEREFLKQIGGNCHLPVAAYCDMDEAGELRLRAMFGSEDGSRLARVDVLQEENDVDKVNTMVSGTRFSGSNVINDSETSCNIEICNKMVKEAVDIINHKLGRI